MTKVSEPPGKLDAALLAAAAAAAGGVVNGPEGEVFDWHAVDWRVVDNNVGRLRQRIFTASQAGDLAKVRNLLEVDASQPQQHAGQRAAGHGAECWPLDRRGRRGSRRDSPGQG